MGDKARLGRGVDDRDVVRRAGGVRRAAAVSDARAAVPGVERLGRESQRRATAYARARGRL